MDFPLWLYTLADGYRGIARSRKKINENPACELCGQTLEKVVVHHRDLNPFNNNIENLQALCRRCHGLTHGKLKTLPEYPELKVKFLLSVYEITKQFYPEEAKYMAYELQKTIDYWSKRGGRTPPLLDPPAIPGISRYEILIED